MRREIALDGSTILTGAIAQPGAPGADAPAEYNGIFAFATPLSVWNCAHNQTDRWVEIEAYDNNGVQLFGDVTHPSPSTIRITWYFPVAGTARVHT